MQQRHQEFPHMDWFCPSCGDIVPGLRDTCPCGTFRYSNPYHQSSSRPTPSPLVPATNQLPSISTPLPSSSSVQRRSGDWDCPTCGDLVFASKDRCRCGAHKPTSPSPTRKPAAAYPSPSYSSPSYSSPSYSSFKPRDWKCSTCGGIVFGSKDRCGRDGTHKPAAYLSPSYPSPSYPSPSSSSPSSSPSYSSPSSSSPSYSSPSYSSPSYSSPSYPSPSYPSSPSVTRKPGDWDCPGCGGLVFASKNRCRCGTLKPANVFVSQRSSGRVCPGCNGNQLTCRCSTNNAQSNNSNYNNNNYNNNNNNTNNNNNDNNNNYNSYNNNHNSNGKNAQITNQIPTDNLVLNNTTQITNNAAQITNNEENKCKICMEDDINTKLPCGHVGLCMGCANANTTCPFCREPYQNTQVEKVFLV